jgi:hypothetical protein
LGDRGGVGVTFTAFAAGALASCFSGAGAGEVRSWLGAPRDGFDIGDSGDLAREGDGGRSEDCWIGCVGWGATSSKGESRLATSNAWPL